MLWGGGITHCPAPTLSAIIRTVHAALVRGPELAAMRAGAEQGGDGVRWVRPAIANSLPTVSIEPAVQPAIRAARDVR